MRLGRMSDSSAAIGLASASSAPPPPNNSACGLEMNDQVTASTRPRAASARLALRVRTCAAVSTGLRGASPRRTASTGCDRRRRCARSPRRCRPCPRCRAARTAPRPSRGCPGRRRRSRAWCSTRRISGRLRSRPASRFTSLVGKSMTFSGASALPATMISDGVPPQRSSTICVASSSPGTMKSGSTPRSKR